MKSKLIFYSARKTALCERSLGKSFSELDLTLKNTTFAADSKELCKKLNEAFTQCDVTFVVGGLDTDDEKSTENVMAHALAGCKPDECKKLQNSLGSDGYVFRLHKQLLILLPDEPEQIEVIMQGPLSGYIKKIENARV